MLGAICSLHVSPTVKLGQESWGSKLRVHHRANTHHNVTHIYPFTHARTQTPPLMNAKQLKSNYVEAVNSYHVTPKQNHNSPVIIYGWRQWSEIHVMLTNTFSASSQ